jgi:hypothetical protein
MNECVICLEPLVDDIVVLSCVHKNNYHYECLKKWISKKSTLTKICTICDENVEILNIINPIEEPTEKIKCCTIL